MWKFQAVGHFKSLKINVMSTKRSMQCTNGEISVVPLKLCVETSLEDILIAFFFVYNALVVCICPLKPVYSSWHYFRSQYTKKKFIQSTWTAEQIRVQAKIYKLKEICISVTFWFQGVIFSVLFKTLQSLWLLVQWNYTQSWVWDLRRAMHIAVPKKGKELFLFETLRNLQHRRFAWCTGFTRGMIGLWNRHSAYRLNKARRLYT